MKQDKKIKFIDKVLSDLNKSFNKQTYPNIKFNFFQDVIEMGKKVVGPYLSDFWGIDEGEGDIYFTLIKEWIRNNYGNGNEALPGDEIILKRMVEDDDPIPSGTKGVVRNINSVHMFNEDHLLVQWENGRSLSAIVGLDEYDVVKDVNDLLFRNGYSWV